MRRLPGEGGLIMLKIAICDKEPLRLCYAAELVGRELSAQRAQIEGYLSLQALLWAVSSGIYTPDVAIFNCGAGRDAAFSKGMHAIQKLNRLAPRCRILFLANYHGDDWEVCERERRYLLAKKQRERQTRDTLKQAVRMLETRPRRTSLAAKTGGKTTVIPLEDVLYVERCGRKCRVVTAKGDYIASQRPEELLLGVEDAFVRCHQGYWVNLARISAQWKNEFYLDNGSSIPMSRTYRRQARARFFAYLKE